MGWEACVSCKRKWRRVRRLQEVGVTCRYTRLGAEVSFLLLCSMHINEAAVVAFALLHESPSFDTLLKSMPACCRAA